jgi:hypothetical protein
MGYPELKKNWIVLTEVSENTHFTKYGKKYPVHQELSNKMLWRIIDLMFKCS